MEPPANPGRFTLWICSQPVPGVAAGGDDGLGVVQHAQAEEALAEVEPDPFHRVQLRAVGRQLDQGDGVGEVVGPDVVPAGAIEDDDGMGVLGQLLGEPVEEEPHGPGGHFGQDQGEVLAGGRADGGIDVGPLVAPVADPGRALALEPPAVADAALVADPRLVLEPELQAVVRVARADLLQRRAKPLFWKRRCARGSLLGWTGRAFCLEKPIRRSTRVRLDGW